MNAGEQQCHSVWGKVCLAGYCLWIRPTFRLNRPNRFSHNQPSQCGAGGCGTNIVTGRVCLLECGWSVVSSFSLHQNIRRPVTVEL